MSQIPEKSDFLSEKANSETRKYRIYRYFGDRHRLKQIRSSVCINILSFGVRHLSKIRLYITELSAGSINKILIEINLSHKSKIWKYAIKTIKPIRFALEKRAQSIYYNP